MNVIVRRNGGERALVPFYNPLSLLEEIDKLARSRWDYWNPFSSVDSLVPYSDIYEEEGRLVVKTELPGISKDDLEVTLEGDRLTIKAEKKEEVEEAATHHTRERYYGSYFRSFTLPFPVKEKEISATLDNGVLELRLPRAEEAKAKKIEIKAQSPQIEARKKQRNHKQKKS